MTKERKIEILKDLLIQLSDSANILCTCEADERCEVVEECIKVLEQQPSDCVSLEVYKQVAWERDIAIEQLKELGYEFGEKIRTSDDCVSREKVWYMITGGKYPNEDYEQFIDRLVKELENMPPVTPTHGTCKDCKHYYMDEDGHGYHCEKFDYTRFPVYADFYCKEYKKRGDSDGSN